MAKLSKEILQAGTDPQNPDNANLVKSLELISNKLGMNYAELGTLVFGCYFAAAAECDSLKELYSYRQTFVCFLAAMSHADLVAFMQTFTEIKLK